MSLIEELKRRNVFKASAAYLALGWVVTQVTGAIVPALNLPASLQSIVVWIGLAGFPFVVIFAWAFEITPEGIKRESEVDRSASITHITSRRLDYIIIGLMVLAIAMFGLDRLLPRNVLPPGDASSSAGASLARDPASAPETGADRAHGALPQSAQVSSPDPKSIAVLPFVNISSDKEQEYFSDGLTEELLNLLARIPQLEVIARTSSFAFKGQNLEIPEIAKRLNVAHILEGSVRKSGSKLRITAQLIEASSGKHLWAETYDRELADVFAIQDEIAGAVVAQLKIALLGEGPKAKAVDPKAYALFLQARALGRQFTPAGYEQSIALLQQALAIDPAYAPAWRALSVNYSNQSIDGLRPSADAAQLGQAAVEHALAADPQYAAAYSTLGSLAMYNGQAFAEAARQMLHALELEPTDLIVLGNAGELLHYIGRTNEAIAVGEYLIERDPVNALLYGNVAGIYLAASLPDKAITAARTALSLSPGYIDAEWIVGLALLQKGDKDGALAAMQREAGDANRLAGIAIAEHALGNAAASDAALAELSRRFATDRPAQIATVLAYRGQVDQAFEWLDRAAAASNTGLVDILVNPGFAALRANPRWLSFLRRRGLAPEQVAAIAFEVTLPKSSSQPDDGAFPG